MLDDDATVIYDRLDAFIEALTDFGERPPVVLRRIEEHRPTPGTGHVPNEKYCRCELLIYRDAVLHKCVLEGARAAEIAGPLTERGVQLTIVSGNIT